MAIHESRPRTWRRVAAMSLAVLLLCAACSNGDASNPADPNRVEVSGADVSGAEATATVETAEVPATVEESRPTGGVVPIVSTGADELRDLIRPGDPSAAYCLVDLGVGPGEFYDATIDALVFPEMTYFFEARYDDGSIVEIRIHPDLVVGDAAMQADRIAAPISLLPVELRRDIERVGFLGGDANAQADGGGEGIHVYEANVAIREGANRFEETIFHESVHTSLDDRFANDPEWLSAQVADGSFLTEYAAGNPATEDLAETALYAWALSHHPNRVSEADAAAWETLVPARIAAITEILSGPGDGYDASSPSCN